MNAPTSPEPLLLRLAVEQEDATPPRLYRSLSPGERKLAALAYLERDPDGFEWLVPRVARALNFRPELLEGWSHDRLAERVVSVEFADMAPRAGRLLQSYHLTERRDLLIHFLDSLGVEHVDGELPSDTRGLGGVDPERVKRAADALVERFGTNQVLLYFLTLLSHQAEDPPGMRDWLRSTGESLSWYDGASESVDEEEGEPEPMPFGAVDQFTTLDHRILYAIVDTAQRVEGAPTEDELDDLVEELIHLNRPRHRSYFHAGFRDVLLGRDVPRADREMNEHRARWYWAGVVSALARREEWAEIVGYYDREAPVRRLGDTGEDASYAGGQLVLLALCRVGRAAEAAEFITPIAAVRCRRIFQSAFHEASRLLREDRAAEARGLLDKLGQAVGFMEVEGTEPHRRIILEVRRRRAHCFRQLGEFAKANELLQRLERDETDPDLRSMVLADLGLIEGGFRSLADLRVPRELADVADTIDSLDRGRDHFDRAVALDTVHSAHARYALGVLALLREEYSHAAEQMELAKSIFAAEPSRYRQGGFLVRADLLLGIALCRDLQAERMEYGTELIEGAVRAGADFPSYMVPAVLDSLSLRSEQLVRRCADVLLEADQEEFLDLLLASSAAIRSSRVLDALMARAGDETRGESRQVEDYRRLLPALLERRRIDDGAEALDFLESAAIRRIGTAEFLQLLDESSAYEPAWEAEDAHWSRIICLESAGEYTAAAGLLEQEFHRVLTVPDRFRLEQAASLVDRIREYGLSEDHTAQLQARLDALSTAQEETEEVDDDLHIDVRVLFVGGNETQAQHDEAIKGDLAETHPRVKVTFMHPGWGSNWNRALEEAERKLETHDALVVMRFNRTQFGRQLRKRSPVPWWSCVGSGKKSIKRSILAAAAVGRRKMRERVAAGGDAS